MTKTVKNVKFGLMENFNERKHRSKVFVAMSGGVDSSVAAALLKKQGFDVTGVFFKPWAPPAASYQLPATSFCQWEQDRQDAMRMCTKLGIPFKTWDFSRKYGKHVAQYMIDSYRAGITPNPDVMCNKEIKFGLFLKKALAEGADYIATGHYVRLSTNSESVRINEYTKGGLIRKFVNSKQIRYSLMAGVDCNKDQSYFLWTLTQKQLKYCLFPIGDYTKPEVRKLAKKFGLPNHDKKDSQGVCFIGQLDMKDFLKNYIKPKTGEIRLLVSTHDRVEKRVEPMTENAEPKPKVIGFHDGVFYYTIGQRHGLDIKDGGGPYYVVHKDIKKNIVYVTNIVTNRQLSATSAEIKNVNWIVTEPKLQLNCQVKIRYRTKSVPANVSRFNLETRKLLIKFKKSVKALTPGQSAVFYRGQEVLGGGVII